MEKTKYRTYCNRCNTKLTWKTHEKYKKSMEKRAYMFTKYQVCTNCNRCFVYEEFKISTKEMIDKLKKKNIKDTPTLFLI